MQLTSPDGFSVEEDAAGRLNCPLFLNRVIPGLISEVRYSAVCLPGMDAGCGACYLLDVLLENTELQPLVEPHLAVLPDALKSPLMVQHLMYHIQYLVHCLGVVGCGCEGLRVPRTQGTLKHIQKGLAILADLQEGKRVTPREWSG